MNTRVTGFVKAGSVAIALGLLSGCATTSDTEDQMAQLRAQLSQAQAAAAAATEQASSARFLAEKAIDEARKANNCCNANTERMERMFKKSMQK